MGKVRFDLALLNEPRARMAWARSCLSIVRDEEVADEWRLEAADRANRLGCKAGDALIVLRDDDAAPRTIRRLAERLIAEINIVLRESFALLHPTGEQHRAPVVRIFPAVPVVLRHLKPANTTRAA